MVGEGSTRRAAGDVEREAQKGALDAVWPHRGLARAISTTTRSISPSVSSSSGARSVRRSRTTASISPTSTTSGRTSPASTPAAIRRSPSPSASGRTAAGRRASGGPVLERARAAPLCKADRRHDRGLRAARAVLVATARLAEVALEIRQPRDRGGLPGGTRHDALARASRANAACSFGAPDLFEQKSRIPHWSTSRCVCPKLHRRRLRRGCTGRIEAFRRIRAEAPSGQWPCAALQCATCIREADRCSSSGSRWSRC